MKIKKIFFTLILSVFAFGTIGVTESYFEIAKNLEIFNSIYKELNSFYVDDINPGKLIKSATDQMLKTLDPYTTYIPESEIEDFRFMTTGQYGGIGAIISKRGDYVFINEPYEGFPAQKAGLIAGDKILEINKKSAKEKTTEEVSKILKGQPNTPVTLLIDRKSEKDPFEVTFNREKVTVKSIPYAEFVDENIAYIKLRSFTRKCADELKKEINILKQKDNLKGLILDLRNNPGGLLNESVDMVNLFVDQGELIVSTRGKIDSWEKEYIAKSAPIFKELPIAILINSSSASASEIVSGAIQDLDRGVIIGQRSYGKGLVQQTRKLPYNSELKVTVAKYYIPSGRCIQALDYSNRNEDGSVGIIPDSLITEYTTRNGRKVYDGGGINPDIITDLDLPGNLIVSLFRERLFFDFATDFRINNPSIPLDFVCSDVNFNEFKEYISDKEYTYKTKTELKLEELKSKAEEEDYFNEFSEEFNVLSQKYHNNKKDDISKSRDKVKEILTAEIMSRYYYQKGRIKAGLFFDTDVTRAIKILKNKDEYNAILTNE